MSTSLLRVRRSLGVALYGEVVECELLQPGPPRIVAVKCMSLPRALRVRAQSAADQAMDDPLQECRVADLLTQNGGHPHVVGSYFHFQEDECLYLVNELCGGGDLHNLVIAASPTHSVDERTSVRFMRQIVAGVDYLHRQLRIAHRDLSLENVLMHEGECKITDFGLSVDATTRCTGPAGKAYYMAPEVVAGVEYDPVKADVWSLGIVWFIMLTGSPLVSVASEHNEAFVSLKRCGVADVLTLWGHNDRLSAAVINVVSRMLRVSPEERISLPEVMAHPIMAGMGP
jgi:serine/threonine protein kinase